MKRRPPNGDGAQPTNRASPSKGRLTAEDEALWRQVAGSVEPLNRKRARLSRAGRLDRQRNVEVPEVRSRSSLVEELATTTAGPATRAAARPLPSSPGKSQKAPPITPPPLADFDRRKARRIEKGHIEIEARIDLHGLRQSEAHHRLVVFLRRAAADGLSTVLVITGKGGRRQPRDADALEDYGSRDEGVLRRAVPRWLAEAELRGIVVSYTAASQRHGGAGALYLHLRKRGRRDVD